MMLQLSLSRPWLKASYIQSFQVSYATAMDIFMVLCLLYVFAPLAEYAIINVMQQYYRKVMNQIFWVPININNTLII